MALFVMTLSLRRTLLNVMIIPAAGAVLFSAFTVFFLLKNPPSSNLVSGLQTSLWWWNWRASANSDVLWAVFSIFFLTIFALIGELILRRGFGRSPSPEIFFFRLFLLTFPLQAARLATIWVFTGNLSPFLGVAMVRIAWFTRYLGILLTIGISLFSRNRPFRRTGTIIGAGVLVSFILMGLMPLDVTQPTGNLLFHAGDSQSLALACLLLEILSVVSLSGLSASRQDNRYYVLGLSLLLVVTGMDFLFFASWPLAAPGAILITAGTVLFARFVRLIYQWV